MLGHLKALGHRPQRRAGLHCRPCRACDDTARGFPVVLPPCVQQVGLVFLTPLWGTQAFTPLSCCEHWPLARFQLCSPFSPSLLTPCLDHCSFSQTTGAPDSHLGATPSVQADEPFGILTSQGQEVSSKPVYSWHQASCSPFAFGAWPVAYQITAPFHSGPQLDNMAWPPFVKLANKLPLAASFLSLLP